MDHLGAVGGGDQSGLVEGVFSLALERPLRLSPPLRRRSRGPMEKRRLGGSDLLVTPVCLGQGPAGGRQVASFPPSGPSVRSSRGLAEPLPPFRTTGGTPFGGGGVAFYCGGGLWHAFEQREFAEWPFIGDELF